MVSFSLLPMAIYQWDATPRCFGELERHFFDPRLVKQSFDLYHVFQSQWDPILVSFEF